MLNWCYQCIIMTCLMTVMTLVKCQTQSSVWTSTLLELNKHERVYVVLCVCRMTVCSMSLLDESRLMSKPPKFAWRVFFRNRCQVGRQRCSRQILKLTPYHYTIQLDFYDFPIHSESLDINCKLLCRVLGILLPLKNISANDLGPIP